MVESIEFALTIGSMSKFDINEIIIDNMNGNIGINVVCTNFQFINSSVTNSHFKNGFYYLNEDKNTSGGFGITNSKFINNTSEYGTIFNIYKTNYSTASGFTVNGCEFTNNTASKFGGVIYSLGKYNILHTEFQNCTFNNNHAKLGDVVYGYSINSMPLISNIKELSSTDVATLPTYFEIDNNSIDKISILSGENIPEGITCFLFDDYGRKMYFPQKTVDLQLEDFVFFNVEIDDPSNAKVLGQTQDYCWDDRCIFPSVKVIGNPGIYNLSLKIKSFGQYEKLIKDSIDIPIEIRECNISSHIYSIVENTNLKSCYIPKCEHSCNTGYCANNDYCDCNGTDYIGKYCNEYRKLERYRLLDILFIIIASIMIFTIIILAVMTVKYENNIIIKGGGIEFLGIILIGLFINSLNTIFLTFNKTTYLCYQIYLFSNTGFSFVFGSIFVKTYRIYKIFCQKETFKLGLSKKIMYFQIILMTLFHWIMAFLWFIFNGVSKEKGYTADKKEFLRCHYPVSKNLSILFNFGVLMCEFVLYYSIRKVEKKYKEVLGIPAYVYIIYMILVNIVNNQDINVLLQDWFDIIGTYVNTLVIIYYLFIVKFKKVSNENYEEITTNECDFRDYKIKTNENDNFFNGMEGAKSPVLEL